MTYKQIVTGTFIDRPNRFLAHVLTDQGEVICHVKNTGRLRELFTANAQVILEYHPDAAAAGRKTSYSLIGIYKEKAGIDGKRQLVNIDSQAPNQAAFEWVSGGFFSPRLTEVRREVVYGSSRFDLAFTDRGRPSFMEVKGVTLEEDGIARFPDAPTERGLKHVYELTSAARAGFGAYLLFVIQMKGVHTFTPNRAAHAAFADALQEAARAGVSITACDSTVTKRSMTIDRRLKVVL